MSRASSEIVGSRCHGATWQYADHDDGFVWWALACKRHRYGWVQRAGSMWRAFLTDGLRLVLPCHVLAPAFATRRAAMRWVEEMGRRAKP